jgi:hypothetical protein
MQARTCLIPDMKKHKEGATQCLSKKGKNECWVALSFYSLHKSGGRRNPGPPSYLPDSSFY